MITDSVLSSVPGRIRLFMLPVAAGFLPLLWWHVAGLLSKPHYQFLWLLPAAIWMLVVGLEKVALTPLVRQEIATATFLLTISMAGLALATYIWSPWIAAVSAWVAIPGLLLGCGGWRNLRNWFPVWLFTFLLVPLPFGMDEDLIVRLRGVTTRLSSSVLDQLGVLHSSYANVIELPGKPLFIADACSGIHSLYVLIAAALFVGLWFHRGIVHTLSLLICTFALVLVENVARIVAVAVALGWNMDLSAGWKHEALGIMLFVLSLILVLTTDQLLLFLIPSRMPSLLVMAYSALAGEAEGKTSRRKTSASVGAVWLRVVALVCCVFPVIGVAQIFLMPAGVPFPSVLSNNIDLPEFGADGLPAELAGFTRTNYTTVERVAGDPLGQASQQWWFRKGNINAMVSLDYPYDGIHDLCVCYSQIGWRIASSRLLDQNEIRAMGADNVGPIALGYLNRELYGNALLIFQLADLNGNVGAVIKEEARGTTDERATRRLRSFGEQPLAETESDEKKLTPPYVQTQIMAQSVSDFSDSDVSDLVKLFSSAQQLLMTRATGAKPLESVEQ